jgi:hypothetical protein
VILMKEKVTEQVMAQFGERFDEIAVALMKGNFHVREVAITAEGYFQEYEISLFVHGAELNINLQKVKGVK